MSAHPGSDPAAVAELLSCGQRGCGAKYHNDEEGWAAHLAVFGHSPGSDDEPPPEEGTAR